MKDKSRLKELYFSAANQYYIAGRFAAFAGFLPICGNLFHHTIEMYIKGYLCNKFSESQLRTLRHDLEEIWNTFKKEVLDPSLDKFDKTIVNLHAFEKIRYPEEIYKKGAESWIDIGYDDYSYSSPNRPEPTYRVSVGQVDILVKELYKKSSVNPLFYTTGLKKEAIKFLKKYNKGKIWKAKIAK